MRPADTNRTFRLPLSTEPGLRRRFMVLDDATLKGNLRLGLLLEILDKLAEEAALDYVQRFHPGSRVVTAAVDRIVMRQAPDGARDIEFHARINHVGRTSMEVGIRVEQPGSPALHVASCYFTMVARSSGETGARSLQLPALEYLDDVERLRAGKAVTRRESYRRQAAEAEEPPSREEYDLLKRLHRAQEEPGFSGLLAGRLSAESWERMYPEQENVPQKIFGGYVMRRAYELASICADRVAPERPVLAAVNRVNFFHPVRMGDILHYTSRLVYAGKASICAETSIQRRSRDRTSEALSNSALFTFVNVDRELHPQPVPPIFPTTYAEDARFLAARREHLELERHTQHGWIATA